MRRLFIGGPKHGEVTETNQTRISVFDGEGANRRYYEYIPHWYQYRCVGYPLMVCDPFALAPNDVERLLDENKIEPSEVRA